MMLSGLSYFPLLALAKHQSRSSGKYLRPRFKSSEKRASHCCGSSPSSKIISDCTNLNHMPALESTMWPREDKSSDWRNQGRSHKPTSKFFFFIWLLLFLSSPPAPLTPHPCSLCVSFGVLCSDFLSMNIISSCVPPAAKPSCWVLTLIYHSFQF